MKFVLAAALLVALNTGAHAFSGGPPPSSCLTLFPLHGVERQTSPAPYRLVLSSATYSPGQNLTGRVEATEAGRQFKGFQVTVHRYRSSGNHEEFVGTFTDTNTSLTQTMQCLDAPRSMVTHKDASPKSMVTFVWTAPNQNLGNLQFFLTVLESKEVFWTRVPFNVQPQSDQPVVPPATMVPTVSVSSSQPPDWSTCHKDKGCWLVPESRRESCDMERGECLAALSFRREQQANQDKFLFELSFKREGQYFSFGLSDDQFMGDDLAVVCTAVEGQESVQLGYNHGVPGPYKYFFSQYSRGLSDLVVGQANGHSFCQFSLPATVSVLNWNVSRPYDLTTRHFLFLSWGRIFQGTTTIYGHIGAPAVSESKVYLIDNKAFSSAGASHILGSTFMFASVILALLLH
ncbi:ferric-chelate reductase 1-like isoform X2 [Babylonia areolata]|uniref:ferric-chelate reductase 1-like isoform X2 n=1 Tax=Babylonia areolata TaxID=304850 RepID=UPI003FCFCDA4